jgi:hypothetical protein
MLEPRVRGRRRPRARTLVLIVAAVLALVLVAAVAWFEPYKLLINTTVDEAAPGGGAALIASGSFASHEHATSGEVRLFRLADGRSVLRLDRLDTSNGPVLKVWLSDAPVREGKAGWHVFATGQHVDLGRLQGNKGSQNYPIPQGVDVTRFANVTIWCDRFHVSFGAAALNETY